MILQIMSDLHLGPGSDPVPPIVDGVDLVVVAGDVREGLAKSVEAMRAAVPDTIAVAMVAGNHEFYGGVWSDEIAAGRDRARQLGVTLLENDSATFGSLRIWGATFWTDYLLFGPSLRVAAMRAAYDQMRDHKRIRWSRDPWMRFRPQEALSLHRRSRGFFEEQLARPHEGVTMLLAHHAMAMEALDPAHERSLLAAAYASEVPFATVADLVVTGHTHRPIDFRRGRTRFVSNPRGYPGEGVRFNPSFLIEVPDD
jgi:predicted phosphodiesterase